MTDNPNRRPAAAIAFYAIGAAFIVLGVGLVAAMVVDNKAFPAMVPSTILLLGGGPLIIFMGLDVTKQHRRRQRRRGE